MKFSGGLRYGVINPDSKRNKSKFLDIVDLTTKLTNAQISYSRIKKRKCISSINYTITNTCSLNDLKVDVNIRQIEPPLIKFLPFLLSRSVRTKSLQF